MTTNKLTDSQGSPDKRASGKPGAPKDAGQGRGNQQQGQKDQGHERGAKKDTGRSAQR